ncbi:putative primase/topoisomerase [Bacillus phage Shanette]|uniref:Primase/topoisomerase n=1 Tax=Bacillus phage Shanette TaxID=1296656 RepID=S5MBA8_9CAUD|nr:primase [Bacillus phage Shanette]AGR47074.1 putative primase/topoisomerase [Bacillus phage Shanette]
MIAVIVEGFSDHDAIRRVYSPKDVQTIVTNGTKFNNRIREQIQEALDMRLPTFILSDPDKAGDDLASMVKSNFSKISRIRVDPDKAKQERMFRVKYGVEYCSDEYLKELLEGAVQYGRSKKEMYGL